MSADLIARLRARAATVATNGARDTAALLTEAAEALEDAATPEIQPEEPDRWFGNNIRRALAILRYRRDAKRRGWPPLPDPLPDPPPPPPPMAR